jgi:threonine aldolase
MFSQATTDQIMPSNGHHLTLEDILPHLQLGENIHYRPTKLICLENTLSGTVFPQEEIKRISDHARKEGIAMHLDGARIWEGAAKEVERRGLDSSDDESLRIV